MKKEYGDIIKSLITLKKEIEKSYKKQSIKHLGDAMVSIETAIHSLTQMEDKKEKSE